MTINFTGTSLAVIAKTGPSYGKAEITLDGGTPVLVDLYSASALNQKQIWSTGTLVGRSHTVKIAWTGLRSVAATWTYVDLDAVDVAGTLN